LARESVLLDKNSKSEDVLVWRREVLVLLFQGVDEHEKEELTVEQLVELADLLTDRNLTRQTDGLV